MVDKDYSFIRLRRTKEEAFNLNESPACELHYEGQVQLKPFDTQPYLQITNNDEGVSVEDYSLFIVDCLGNEFDATESLYIEPFIDSDNIQQIAFELIYIKKDFGSNLVYLRIDQSNEISYYSNKILITNRNIDLTSRIDYRHNERYFGTDYPILNLYQSIRLQFYYNDFVSKSENSNYYQISRSQNVSIRANISQLNEYQTGLFNAWTNKRLELALNSDEVYINEVRSELYESYESEQRVEASNVSQSKFLVDPDENNIITPYFQIYEGLKVSSYNPIRGFKTSIYNSISINTIIITFNQEIQYLNFLGTIKKPSGQIVNINENNTNITQNILTIDTTNVFNEIGVFNVNIKNNSIKGLNLDEVWKGVADYNITVVQGDYNNNDYNNNDYLIF